MSRHHKSCRHWHIQTVAWQRCESAKEKDRRQGGAKEEDREGKQVRKKRTGRKDGKGSDYRGGTQEKRKEAMSTPPKR
eukprot:scaffold152225_cov14-Tisochrysis_lutea.AAC.1